jgi:hypothetical protein
MLDTDRAARLPRYILDREFLEALRTKLAAIKVSTFRNTDTEDTLVKDGGSTRD